MFKTCSIIASLVLFAVIGVAQISPHPARAQTQVPPASASPTGLQALKDDAQRMQVLLNQMKENVAFVGSTTTPLNHQFQLEIEMWQTVLGQMQRRIAELERSQQNQR